MVPAAVLLLLLALGGAALWAAHTRTHRLKREVVLTEIQYTRLLELAERSLESSDVPVGAILFTKALLWEKGTTPFCETRRRGNTRK